MVIGAGGEIGVRFGRWGEMTESEKDVWCATFRDRFGHDLMRGYGTVAYPRFAEIIRLFPVKDTCDVCGGSGNTSPYDDAYNRCPECHGKGWVETNEDS